MDDAQLLNFAEFCLREKEAGGPDPHMKLAGRLAQGKAPVDVWLIAGIYVACYNYPTTERIYEWLSQDRLAPQGAIEDWLREHWEGIATRRERRSVRSPEKMARCLATWRDFADAQVEWLNEWGPWGDAPAFNYEVLWETSQRHVYALGRYATLKLLEFLRRYTEVPLVQPDYRLAGGWSPREGLALLIPEEAERLNGDDRPEYVARAEMLAAHAHELATEATGGALALDRYEMQVLLCDYKQCWSGLRQYPGRSQDSELEYEAQIMPHWGDLTDMGDYRAELFPHWALGERNDWDGVRKELGHVLREQGYMWSDKLYDYRATADSGDWAHPVRKQALVPA